jgi:Type IV secretion system pilin
MKKIQSPVAGAVVAVAVILGAVFAGACPALAAQAGPVVLAAESLNQVIDNIRNVVVGLLAGLATLFLTVGGVRYLFAGGDLGEVEKAKNTLKYAAWGYGIALLAPLLVSILKQVVGA